MENCAIICEFNPFHNGHEYLIKTAKEKTNEKIICLMSGDFSQHGEPTIQDKFTRAKNAINCGADVVLELPTIFACSNAENFAYGAIKILKALNVKHLFFGIEKTNLETLWKIAKIKYDNSVSFQNCFKNEIENGFPFNVALKRAILNEIGDNSVKDVLSHPNNILAIEYLTAILKLKSKIIPVAIERIDNGFESKISNNKYVSATAIRDLLTKNEDVSCYVPKNCKIVNFFNSKNQEIYEKFIIGNLRKNDATNLGKFYDFNDGIEYKIKKEAENAISLNELKSKIVSPRYKENRINKLLIYPLVGATKQVVEGAKKSKSVCKCLAIRKDFKLFLSNINKSKISVITRNDDYKNLTEKQKQVINIDLIASNIYDLISNKPQNNDKKIGTMFL